MLVRFRQTAAGLQCSLVETRRIDGKVRYEHVASLGSVPASPSVGDRLGFWRLLSPFVEDKSLFCLVALRTHVGVVLEATNRHRHILNGVQ